MVKYTHVLVPVVSCISIWGIFTSVEDSKQGTKKRNNDTRKDARKLGSTQKPHKPTNPLLMYKHLIKICQFLRYPDVREKMYEAKEGRKVNVYQKYLMRLSKC